MEVKKNPKVNLEKKKGMFMQVGLILSISLVLVAFNWTSEPEKSKISFDRGGTIEELDMIINTERKKVEPPVVKPPKVEYPDLKIVEDDHKIENENTFNFDMTAEETDAVAFEMPEEIYEPDDDNFYIAADKMPTFKGGDLADFRNWVQKRLRYPTIAQEEGIQGKVYIEFIVDKTGKVTNVKVLRGVDPLIDNEAVRVVKSSPRWTPGEQRTRKVNVKFSIPILFRLQG
ncbi:MAG: energy transducer TonB [Bacteroidales bacterium]|jgi:protein TonB|nr:energy transducer TonB [Bacteroidales bacterium]